MAVQGLKAPSPSPSEVRKGKEIGALTVSESTGASLGVDIDATPALASSLILSNIENEKSVVT
jgi:hypothetical protein